MKKYLPIIINFVLCGIVFLFLFSSHGFAQVSAGTITTPADGSWIFDADVNFSGKMAVRAREILDFTLFNYAWAKDVDALRSFWFLIFTIVSAFFVLLVLITAFVLILSRGKSITFRRFIPRFIFVIILVVLSFSIVQFLYQITDIIQGFFIRSPRSTITAADLLSVAFDYDKFVGLRKAGALYDESVFISLLLVKLTAITQFVMCGILIIRKIILWFFIIISPVFPLLLLYAPVRNTAKIWIGEFFRWLLYAPIYAIFLSGLVALWKSRPSNIPLDFSGGTTANFPNIDNTLPNDPRTDQIYPTAINILIGGPGQSLGAFNNINTTETFALYLISLMMLWAITLLPFVLLQIFLTYAQNLGPDNAVVKQIVAATTTLMGRSTSPAPVSPSGFQPAGLARVLPFFAGKAKAIPMQTPAVAPAVAGQARALPLQNARSYTNQTTNASTAQQQEANISNITTNAQTTNSYTTYRPTTTIHGVTSKQSSEVLKLTNLAIPSLRDVARYERSMISKDTTKQQEITHIREVLERIANPSVTNLSTERDRYKLAQKTLLQETQTGNPLAAAILSASSSTIRSSITNQQSITRFGIKEVLEKLANPTTVVSPLERTRFTLVKEKLALAQAKGDPLATQVTNAMSTVSQTQSTSLQTATASTLQQRLTEEKQKGNTLATDVLSLSQAEPTVGQLPSVNRIQSVSLDDYEAVKKMWQENYQNLEPPKASDGSIKSRKEWVKEDIHRISNVINLLSSADPEKNKQGMDSVVNILPFLLIGGFSQTEVTAYLKSKLEAAKTVADELEKQENEEESLVEAKTTGKKEDKTMTASAEIEPVDTDTDKKEIKSDEKK